MHNAFEHIAERIRHDVSFAPFIFLSASYPRGPPASVVLTDWLSMAPACCLPKLASMLSAPVDDSEQTVIAHAVEMVLHCRQTLPHVCLASRPNHLDAVKVEDCQDWRGGASFTPISGGLAVFGLSKKRVRSNDRFASDKRGRRPYPLTFVPPVNADLMEEGFTLYRSALGDAGDPKSCTVNLEQELVHIQAQLKSKYGQARADAVMARVTLLAALLRQDTFQQIYKAERELPNRAMLKVAGIVPAMDGDENIDVDAFAEMLAETL